MNGLLLWNAFCLACVLVYIHEPKRPQKKRKPRDPWIASMVAHAQGLNGFSDPLYNTDESAPMELHR